MNRHKTTSGWARALPLLDCYVESGNEVLGVQDMNVVGLLDRRQEIWDRLLTMELSGTPEPGLQKMVQHKLEEAVAVDTQVYNRIKARYDELATELCKVRTNRRTAGAYALNSGRGGTFVDFRQ